MRRKAILLTTTPETSEMEELVFSLGADVAAIMHQRRAAPDPQLFLGSGKMEEVRDTARATGADIIVVNGVLRPGQVFSLQSFLDGGRGQAQVFDRTRLILEIFRERARSPEARLQVELAQLHYDMPLVKEAISREKRGERQAAMFGAGEYAADVEYDRMKKRMARIRRDLERMRLERGVRRKHRRRSGFRLVSLAGYTNAGKSSLLEAMSERQTLVEDRYFSTLSTKTARVAGGAATAAAASAHPDRPEILVTDTVGFIEDLPPWMVDAFHSTLEEIALADVILLVVDASDPVEEMARRLRSSLRILHEFDLDVERGAQRAYRRGLAPILVALNKVDRAGVAAVEEKRRALEADGLLAAGASAVVSAATGEGLLELYERLYALLPRADVPATNNGASVTSRTRATSRLPKESAAARKFDFSP